ncbi:MAG: hypothetical protein WAX77_02525 [Methylococcaceae bacterium]
MQTITSADKARLWQRAWHQLHAIAPIDIDIQQIEDVLHALPPRRIEQSLSDWLKQRYMIEQFNRVAASSKTNACPLPDCPLETDKFCLTITEKNNTLHLTLQALGMALYDFAQIRLELINATNAEIIAYFILDNNGFAKTEIQDNAKNRYALLKMQLYAPI